MSILNETEIKAKITEYDALIAALEDGGNNTAAEVRETFLKSSEINTDQVESLQSYPGVITDNGITIDNINITGTPTKLTTFSVNSTSPNTVLESDQVNSLIKVYEPALYFVTFRFYGQWSAGEDLKFEIYLNDSPNPITPVAFIQEGAGGSDPIIVSVTDIAYIVNSAAIGGTNAEISVYVSSTTGDFTVDQLGITFGAEYNPLSIRTVG